MYKSLEDNGRPSYTDKTKQSKSTERAEYDKLDDGSWFAEIPGFQGVWTNGDTVEQYRNELLTVLEDWLLLKVRYRDSHNHRPFLITAFLKEAC